MKEQYPPYTIGDTVRLISRGALEMFANGTVIAIKWHQRTACWKVHVKVAHRELPVWCRAVNLRKVSPEAERVREVLKSVKP